MISSEKIRSEIQSWVKFFWMIWSDNNNCIDYRKTKKTILFFPYVTNNINHFFKEKTILVGYRKLYKWFVRPSFKNNCRHPFRTNFLMKGNLTFIIYIYIFFLPALFQSHRWNETQKPLFFFEESFWDDMQDTRATRWNVCQEFMSQKGKVEYI